MQYECTYSLQHLTKEMIRDFFLWFWFITGKISFEKRSLIDSLKGSFTKKAMNELFGLTCLLPCILRQRPPASILTLFVLDNIILAPFANGPFTDRCENVKKILAVETLTLSFFEIWLTLDDYDAVEALCRKTKSTDLFS